MFQNGATLDRGASERSAEDRIGVPHGVLTPFFDELVSAGYLARGHDVDTLTLTTDGRAQVMLIVSAWHDLLVGELHEWLPSQEDIDEHTVRALQRVVTRLVLEEQKPAVAT